MRHIICMETHTHFNDHRANAVLHLTGEEVSFLKSHLECIELCKLTGIQ